LQTQGTAPAVSAIVTVEMENPLEEMDTAPLLLPMATGAS
jgi:hypothetical protein